VFASVATLGSSLDIATVGSWYGGWLDDVIQRITEIFLVLAFLSILIMIATFFFQRIWTILASRFFLVFLMVRLNNIGLSCSAKRVMYIVGGAAYGGATLALFSNT